MADDRRTTQIFACGGEEIVGGERRRGGVLVRYGFVNDAVRIAGEIADAVDRIGVVEPLRNR